MLLAGAASMLQKAAALAASDGLLVAFAVLGVFRGALLGCLLWISLLVPAAILSEESRSYRSLEPTMRVEWLSRIISNVHAAFVTAGLYIAVFREPIDGLHAGGEFVHRELFRVVLTLGLGYFLYDSLLVFCMRATISSPYETLAHHAVSILGTIYVLNVDRPLAYVWCSGLFLTEASTPFVNQRWFFAIRHRNEKRYKATGLLMTTAFIIARPIGIPAFLCWMWQRPNLFTSLDEALVREIYFVGILGCSSLYVLNLYWTVLIVRGLFRALKPATGRNRTPVSSHANVVNSSSHVRSMTCVKDVNPANGLNSVNGLNPVNGGARPKVMNAVNLASHSSHVQSVPIAMPTKND